MKLETKFNIWDTIYFIWDDLKLKIKFIKDIRIEIKEHINIYYFYDIMTRGVIEKRTFHSKGELLESIN